MKITEAGVVGALAGLMVPQMALRVTRGLFRLWLVLSVLWIGGVAFAARTVDGFSFIRAEIIKVAETSVSFRGSDDTHGSVIGGIDRVTGAVEAFTSLAKLTTSYSLKCRPTQRMF